MAMKPVLLDRWGNPVRRQELTKDVGGPTIGGVRSPISGYPADGLNPVRLANILRDADQGDPISYLELAETIEERDPHFLGVIGTRKRSVSQIEVTVEAASDDAHDVEIADMVREWLKRDELQQEMFHILDCIAKGYSFTAIKWATSEGQYYPEALTWRDPRHFRFQRRDLATPMMLDDDSQWVPLAPFQFIYADIPAKSGLTLRSGLSRVAAWGWMFKAFTARDWAIFSQTYGQPLRIGKWKSGASEADKDTLFRAVANIAGDCAAIIPDSMAIEFVETANVGSSSDLYEKRVDHLDRQITKAVLGQTGTTDATPGGYAVGKVQRLVQEDIERADAIALAAILNRDLIRPWVQLEYGPQKRYPRLRIERPTAEDLVQLSEAVATMVDLGMEVEESEVRDRFGFSEPKAGARILRRVSGAGMPVQTPAAAPAPVAPEQDAPFKRFSDVFKRGEPETRPTVALNAQQPSAANSGGVDPVDQMLVQLQQEAGPAMAGMLGQIEAMMQAAGSMEEFREMLLSGFPTINSGQLAGTLALAMISANAFGSIEVGTDG